MPQTIDKIEKTKLLPKLTIPIVLIVISLICWLVDSDSSFRFHGRVSVSADYILIPWITVTLIGVYLLAIIPIVYNEEIVRKEPKYRLRTTVALILISILWALLSLAATAYVNMVAEGLY